MRFPEPSIREARKAYVRFDWRIAKAEALPMPRDLVGSEIRRSCRKLSAPTLFDLSTLLWHSARCQEALPSPPDFDLQLRPAPSAGAIHPIHILIEHPQNRCWTRYNPVRHQLEYLSDGDALAGVRVTAMNYVDPGEGVLLLFTAEPGLTEAKYENHASLVWRDAGVLQGTIALVAPQAGLATCLLGLTADRFVASLGKQSQLIGVGAAILGTPR